MSRPYALSSLACLVFIAGCGSKSVDPAAEVPPAPKVEEVHDPSIVSVEHPEQYPLVTATAIDVSSSLTATGTVAADVTRQVPVISLASGRAVEIFARLGDSVRKGQILMRVQSTDISSAYADYLKAVADQKLAHRQLERVQDLQSHGAIAKKDVEIAETADQDALVAVNTSAERLRVLGADLNHPSSIVDVRAPIAGVITEQNITAAGPVKTLDNSPNLFTVSDLSVVWVMCDVYENDLPQIREGEFATIHLSSYPDLVLRGRVDNIGPVLDPSLRTAKVRLQVRNPGPLRIGMFVTASFEASKKALHAVVPSSAVLHLHDHDWVYVPDSGSHFRLLTVAGGPIKNNLQEITAGLEPGQKVVSNALVLQNSVEQ